MLKGPGNQLTRDPNHIAIQFANNFQALDGAGTAKKSPLTVSTTVLTITPPLGAIQMVAYALTNPIRISDDSTCADHYFTIQTATQPVTFDICNEKPFYVLRDGAADGVLHFYFKYL